MELPYYVSWTDQQSILELNIDKSSGAHYLDADKRKIIDLSSTSFQAGLGHSNQHIKNAIKNQIDDFPISSPKMQSQLKLEASQKLLSYMKKSDGKIFYTVSGAESIENALKMARQISKKKIVLARNISYHGATLGALSVTGDWRNKAHATIDQWTARIPEPLDDPQALEVRRIIQKLGADNIAALCLETITGGNGVLVPTELWWTKIQELCTEFNIFLIVDEVICGFGRTGKDFGYQHYKIDPDFICLAKNITAGMIPFGAVWTSKRVTEYYQKNVLSCGLTNYAHPLGLAAMVSVIDQLNCQETREYMASLTKHFHKLLKTLNVNPLIKDIRSIGLLAAVELASPISLKLLLKHQIFVAVIGNNIVLAPAYCLKNEELSQAFIHLEAAILENQNVLT